MNKLDEFFAILGDGKWHNLREIAQVTGIQYEKLIEIVNLFAKANIVQHDKRKNTVKINDKWSFLTKENWQG